ncbi:Uncharacterised protein [uncultured Comamonas sp.]|nr:Uncharacterised protein [uncultured Comamonas sp.]
MTRFYRIHNEKQQSSVLVIAVEKTVSNINQLIFVADLLKKRFDIQLALIFKTPELLFFNRRLLHWIAQGSIDRILITDDPKAFWFDCMEFAKRQEVDQVFFAELPQLKSTWAEFLKFKVELLDAEISIARACNGQYLAVSQKYLRDCPSINLESFESLYWSIGKEPIKATHSQEAKNPGVASLFVTKQGLERFGGEAAFRSIDILIDGHLPAKYKRLWQIDNDLDLDAFCKQDIEVLRKSKLVTIPGLLRNAPGRQILLDINPAPQRSEPTDSTRLQTARTVLTVTTCNQWPLQKSNASAIFIMSNYNKASYIASALYSVAMQTHPHCSVHMVDDVSTDQSMHIVSAFKKLVDSSKFDITLEQNKKSMGTYWIRNSVVHRHINSDTIYLVNDSDDFSCCQRAGIQLSLLEKADTKAIICFGDIVRVDKQFKLLALDGKVERYGTASLACRANSHQKYGYYENIRKNADTEFIERLRYFEGKHSTQWFRYPVLFQPFDGMNLTADIYKVDNNGKSMQSDLSQRTKHKEIFLENYKKINKDLSRHFSYPNYLNNQEYLKQIPEFLI